MNGLQGAQLGKRGIVYVATGRPYVLEAAESAKTARQQMPGIPIVLYTDQKLEAIGSFDHVFLLKEFSGRHLDKIQPLLEFPFERALFLDSDTIVCRPCAELFDLLDFCDFAAAAEPARHPDSYKAPGIPPCFAEINTGVMLYRNSEAVAQLLRDWLALAIAGQQKTPPDAHDQPAFREALAKSNVRFYTLPPEYNLRADFPAFLPAWAELKILHARKGDLAAMRELIDSSSKIRVFLPGKDRCKPEHFAILAPRLNRFVRWQFALIQKFAGRSKGVAK
jgi:hypothetical protein